MRFMEQNQVVAGLLPYDMGGGAGTGDWVSLKLYDHVTILFIKDAGDAGEDPTITIQQATDVSGTSAKALNFTELYVKQGTQSSTGTFTKTTQSSANTYTSATAGENEAIWAIEFDADDLDVDNNFDCINASLGDVGSGTGAYGTILYILSNARYARETMPSAIAD